ncbi:hypothetical protein ABZW18_30290 [Streptomyces sp. NPDC004647]|uniref:NucA/NucB deoxyribonuclease domain-containing protein n=1 Tax=Streptomyces sp. NPDC004647 TaxID=3154671 RepID=UPI0033A02F72
MACLEVTEPHDLSATTDRDVSVQDIVPVPDWCLENPDGQTWGVRTGACRVSGLTYTTFRTVNGVKEPTGQADLNVINYSYSATDLEASGHQIEVSAYKGWGDALKASVGGAASGSGKCTRDESTFPAKPIQPMNSWRQGESYFTTTATAAGAIGTCTTKWNLTFTNAPYAPAGTSARAQASGLPGATFQAPLTRTTNQRIIDENRTKACGDAPSIQGKSCDEYPLASTYQGLSAGGERRTFDNCSFNLPQQSGSTGVSVCMIAEGDNNAQGGLHSQFYKRERVLDGAPFRVLVVD